MAHGGAALRRERPGLASVPWAWCFPGEIVTPGNKRTLRALLSEFIDRKGRIMMLKERRFHQLDPSDEAAGTLRASPAAELEARAADFLASLADVDVTGMSAVMTDGVLVLGGFAASVAEAERAANALVTRFPELAVDNRVEVG